MTMQHSKRALPFRKNDKPSKHNSLSTVKQDCTHSDVKPKARQERREQVRLVCASYDPISQELSSTVLNGDTYLTKKERLSRKERLL